MSKWASINFDADLRAIENKIAELLKEDTTPAVVYSINLNTKTLLKETSRSLENNPVAVSKLLTAMLALSEHYGLVLPLCGQPDLLKQSFASWNRGTISLGKTADKTWDMLKQSFKAHFRQQLSLELEKLFLGHTNGLTLARLSLITDYLLVFDWPYDVWKHFRDSALTFFEAYLTCNFCVETAFWNAIGGKIQVVFNWLLNAPFGIAQPIGECLYSIFLAPLSKAAENWAKNRDAKSIILLLSHLQSLQTFIDETLFGPIGCDDALKNIDILKAVEPFDAGIPSNRLPPLPSARPNPLSANVKMRPQTAVNRNTDDTVSVASDGTGFHSEPPTLLDRSVFVRKPSWDWSKNFKSLKNQLVEFAKHAFTADLNELRLCFDPKIKGTNFFRTRESTLSALRDYLSVLSIFDVKNCGLLVLSDLKAVCFEEVRSRHAENYLTSDPKPLLMSLTILETVSMEISRLPSIFDKKMDGVQNELNATLETVVIMISTTVLQQVKCFLFHDFRANAYEETRSFWQDESIAFSLRHWLTFMRAFRVHLNIYCPDLWSNVIFSSVLSESLCMLSARFAHTRPSKERLQQFRCDIMFSLVAATEFLSQIVDSPEQFLDVHEFDHAASENNTWALETWSKNIKSVHNACRYMFSVLTILCSPVDLLYRVLKKGHADVVDKWAMQGQTHQAWLHFIQPKLFPSASIASLQDLPTTTAVFLATKNLVCHTQPTVHNVLKLLYMKDYTVAILFARYLCNGERAPPDVALPIMEALLWILGNSAVDSRAMERVLEPIVATKASSSDNKQQNVRQSQSLWYQALHNIAEDVLLHVFKEELVEHGLGLLRNFELRNSHDLKNKIHKACLPNNNEAQALPPVEDCFAPFLNNVMEEFLHRLPNGLLCFSKTTPKETKKSPCLIMQLLGSILTEWQKSDNFFAEILQIDAKACSEWQRDLSGYFNTVINQACKDFTESNRLYQQLKSIIDDMQVSKSDKSIAVDEISPFLWKQEANRLVVLHSEGRNYLNTVEDFLRRNFAWLAKQYDIPCFVPGCPNSKHHVNIPNNETTGAVFFDPVTQLDSVNSICKCTMNQLKMAELDYNTMLRTNHDLSLVELQNLLNNRPEFHDLPDATDEQTKRHVQGIKKKYILDKIS